MPKTIKTYLFFDYYLCIICDIPVYLNTDNTQILHRNYTDRGNKRAKINSVVSRGAKGRMDIKVINNGQSKERFPLAQDF